MHDTAERPGYHRSGRVAWLRFLPAAAATLALAGVMAWVLFLVFEVRWYYCIAAPALAALPVAGAAYGAVALGHCRNVWVAGLFAFMAALTVYLGYFHAHFVSLAGPQALHRVDFLPRFIAFRMATDVVTDDVGQAKAPEPVRNWLFFVIDLLMAWVFVAIAAVEPSNRAYCEDCRRWMRRLTTGAAPGSGKRIADALDIGELEALAPMPRYELKLSKPGTMIDLEYCPSMHERATPCQVFLSVTEHQGGSIQNQKANKLLAQVALGPEEVALLAERVMAFRVLLLTPPGERTEEARLTAPFMPRQGVAATDIQRLPPETAGTSSKWIIALAMSLSLMPVIAFLGGIGLLVWGSLLAPWALAPTDGLLGWLLLAGGTAGVLFSAVVCWTNADYFSLRYQLRLTRRALAQRGDALVTGNDPAAIGVSIVPRAQWSRPLSNRESDGGLLLVDLTHRQLLFEGMKERIRIPAGALLSCEVEPIAPTGRWTFYVTVVKANYPANAPLSLSGGHRGDEWEMPLLTPPFEFRKYNRAYRLAAAEALRDCIRVLKDVAQPQQG